MKSNYYLIFTVNSHLYGVEASFVQEIFSLPELTIIPDSPDDIIGVVNLRGQILPVMDINLRFRYQTTDYKITDSVIVFTWENIKIGMIVNQVHQVENIEESTITKKVEYGRELKNKNNALFLAGIAKLEKDLVTLLKIENLIKYIEIENLDIKDDLNQNEDTVMRSRIFCPDATAEEREIFQQRALNLMSATKSEDFIGLIPLAVIGLNEECFGVELKLVREFTETRKITPIPCCPPHIVGNINLRGEILTLVDIRGILNFNYTEQNTAKAMVIQVDDLVVGVLINDVFDVTYIKTSDLMLIPTAVHTNNNEYLRGTASFRDKIMTILELEKIFRQGELIVNNEL